MSDSDSGFGSLVVDDIEPKKKEPIVVAVVPSVEKANEELSKRITSALRNDNLRPMCANGYHGMCKYGRDTCNCQCHKATIRKSIM